MSGSINSPVYLFVYNRSGDVRNGEEHAKHDSDGRIRRCVQLFIEKENQPERVLPPILRGDGAKPRFKTDIGVLFSVSHSGKYWLCAVSEQETGADIQQVKSRVYNGQAIAKRFFHPGEHAYLETNGYHDFFKIWTAKESYVKYTGRGIGGGLSKFSVVSNGRIAESVNGVQIQFLPLDPDYCLCLCAAAIGEVYVVMME
ncbi:MAG: 4'-phosphopantetheinyl transferase superfamily protein [Oscillospiraceae bacterium]|nr:4'-phosphopantetheinyl transferase superfamily protein [Oscillospiraceae bacterium]